MQFRGGMNELMRQAARMQRKIDQAKAELKEREIVVEGLGGKVKVDREPGPQGEAHRHRPGDAQDRGDATSSSTRVCAAINQGIEQADKQMEAEIEKVTGGVKIPGMV